MKVVIIGGTGLIGPKVVAKLRGHGHEAVAASPESGASTLTGEGLAEALRGAAVVVDVLDSPSFHDAEVNAFFAAFRARKLLAAEGAAGVTHHVALSVVRTERMSDNGYFSATSAREKLIKESSIPYSLVRATPFFESVNSIADAATHGGTVRLAPVPVQPVAADDVASAVANIAVSTPVNGVIEVAGPERFRLDELIRRGLSARHDPRDVVTDPDARYFGAPLCEHALAPGNGARLGETRFEEWLTRSTGQPANAPAHVARDRADGGWCARGRQDGLAARVIAVERQRNDCAIAEAEVTRTSDGKRKRTMVTYEEDLERVVNQALAEDAERAAPYSLPCNTPEFYNNDEDVDCEKARE